MRGRFISKASVPVLLALAVIACLALVPTSASALEPLTLRVDARIGATRTFAWTIEKSVDVASFDLLAGQTATPNYTVTATKNAGTDSDFRLTGTITITNPSTSAATLTGVSVSVIGGNPVAVTGLTFPLTLAPGAQAEATFSDALPDSSAQLLLVSAATAGPVSGDAVLANAVYEGPTSFVDDTVTIDDSLAGTLGTLSDTGTFTYALSFGYGDAGVHDNVATILSTGQQTRASVRINALAPTSVSDELRDAIEFFDRATESRGLVGVGPGKSAPHRLHALRNMLVNASRLLAEGADAAAREQLQDVIAHCDGASRPTDFVAGGARAELTARLQSMVDRLKS